MVIIDLTRNTGCLVSGTRIILTATATRALGEMLQLAYHLDELTLMFIDDYREHHDRLLTPLIPLNTLRGLNHLPSLRRLSLANFRIGKNQLVQFLLAIAKTLQYIKVGALVIDYGTWLSTFKKLRGQLPKT